MSVLGTNVIEWLRRLYGLVRSPVEVAEDERTTQIGEGRGAQGLERPLELLRGHVLELDWYDALEVLLSMPWGQRKIATCYVLDHLIAEASLPNDEVSLIDLPIGINRRVWWALVLERLAKADDPRLGLLVHRLTGARLSNKGGRVGLFYVDPDTRRFRYCSLIDFGAGPIRARRVVEDLHVHTHLPLAGASVMAMREARYRRDGMWEAVVAVWG